MESLLTITEYSLVILSVAKYLKTSKLKQRYFANAQYDKNLLHYEFLTNPLAMIKILIGLNIS
ncbi:hypothetical protein [Helicobacter sp. T3_23-1056]